MFYVKITEITEKFPEVIKKSFDRYFLRFLKIIIVKYIHTSTNFEIIT